MLRRLRGGSSVAEVIAEDGPFASFTDLAIGIIFLFLILVAALMLIHQDEMRRAKLEIAQLQERIRQLEAELATRPKLDPNDTPFRLGVVFNSFQRPAGSDADWKFTRTVQIFRATNGNCLENVTLRNNLNLAWKPPVEAQDVPTIGKETATQKGAPCTLTASGERWNSATETGGVDRVSPNLYSGYTVLHAKDGEKSVEIQFRILGVYDDYFRSTGTAPGHRLPPPPASTQTPTGTRSLQ
jgi:hypothetical protein